MINCINCKKKFKRADAACRTKCVIHQYVYLCEECNDFVEEDLKDVHWLDKAAKRHTCISMPKLNGKNKDTKTWTERSLQTQ
jgi:hypothetical protein